MQTKFLNPLPITAADTRVRQHAMGTVMAHRAAGLGAGERSEQSECLEAVCAEVSRIETLLSCYLEGSEVSCINRLSGRGSVRISPETLEVLIAAVEFSRRLPGCFDVTVGSLVSLWNRAGRTLDRPDETSLRSALSLVDFHGLRLDPWEQTAGLSVEGQSIDLGGIGKGYAGDCVRQVYHAYGISSACSNLGGNVVTLGARPDGSPWQVGIQHPRMENSLIGSVEVIDRCVVTSGDYQRFYLDRNGIRRHHILDPSTGYPAQSGLVSVTVVAERSIQADALSTALFVAGLEKSKAFLRNTPGVEAILIDEDLCVTVTPGLAGNYHGGQGIRWKIFDR